jgi:hypothetical protein
MKIFYRNKIRRVLIPYLKDTKKRRHSLFEEGQADSEWAGL